MLHTLELFFLEPATTLTQLQKICKLAIDKNCTQLTVPPLLIKQSAEYLSGTGIQISAPVGYPYGWSAIESKLSEIILAIVDGAAEIDFFINLTALKNQDWQYLAKELNMALTIVRKQGKRINIVIEAHLLTEDEITKCCDLYGVAGVDCITVNTGFGEVPHQSLIESIRNQLTEAIPLKCIVPDNAVVSSLINRYALIVK
ncbi:MAG TPA: 2-deoxyribose-5-phosphate aldolase [Ferruginibacter sp.]|nr:2-deoxyribose-5-phosphate aldolase [Ferruginibacter sp.]HRE63043.1 2-deoxyribose-5-phosphate aldolase [Ferruginibacter sp.]